MSAALQLELAPLKREWLDEAQTGFEALKLERFTTDDLHGVLPWPEHANWWGVLLARLKNQGRERRVGYQPSTRPEANGRVVAVWERID